MKTHMKQAVRAVLGVLMCMAMFTIASTVHAQTTTGSIYGTVTDPGGATIPNCTVTAQNVATKVSQSTVTNGSGDYTFQTVDPGDYQVSTTSSGFKSQTQTGISVSANQNVHVTFALTLGSTAEKVEVTAGVTMVDTRESQIAETIGQKRLQELPSVNRDVYSLLQTIPGVTNYSADSLIGSAGGTTFSVNGLAVGTAAFYIDGAYNNAFKNAGNGGNVVPNPDALQEFRVITSNFDAEFGRTPGAVVNTITRSGTDSFHGEAYDYIRNDVFNAKNYFLDSVTPLKQNQFGGTLGGPMLRNGKAFFFGAYQGTIQHTPANVAGTAIVTPTALERTGDFRKSTIVPNVTCNGVKGVICPSAIDPVAANLLQFVPVYDPVAKRTVQQTANADDTVNQGLGRIDYHGFNNHSIELMFFNQRGTENAPGGGGNQILDYSGEVNTENQLNAVIADTWIISANTVNTLRLFYTDNRFITSNIFPEHTLASLGSQASEGGPIFGPPVFNITGFWQMGPSASGPNDLSQLSYGLIDTVNLNRGQHSMKLGGSYALARFSTDGNKTAGGVFTFTGAATKNPVADFLEGKANKLVQTSTSVHREHSYDPALFFQDDWQIRPRLNINLGLRWEVFPPYPGDGNGGTFRANTQSTVIPSAPLGLLFEGDHGVPAGVFATSFTRFAPRVGFAADVFGHGRTSLRGGFGIFYYDQAEILTGQLTQQPYVLSITTNQTPNLVTPYAPAADPFPFVFNPAKPVFISGGTVLGISPSGGAIPYVEEYNLTVEQQLNRNFSLHVGYVGNATRKDYLAHDINAPTYTPGASTTTAGINARRPYQPNPKAYTFADIQLNDNVNNGTYNSLQVTLRGRVTSRFTMLASYVWGKSLNFDGPNVDGLDISKNFGPSTVDLRQRFVASYTYAFPDLNRFGVFGRQVVDGWHVSGITAFSSGNNFTVTSGVDTNLDGNNNDRVNIVGAPYLPNSQSRTQKIQAFINPSAFQVPTGPYGNEQARSLVGPGNINTDLSLFKDFPIGDRMTFRFRAEAFNVFGNVNLGNPRTNLLILNTGVSQITSAAPARILQFAGKLRF